MDWIEVLVGTVVAYLIGSIPFGILIGKLYYGIDIREHGSGVATHLNIQRVMGWKAGVLTRVLDTAKGFLAASIAYIIHRKYGLYDAYEIPMMQMTFGLAAVMGHIFPVFAQFRGGKGVHCSAGVLLAVNPMATLVCGITALVIFFISRFPNLGYLVASIALPVFVWASRNSYGEYLLPMIIFGILLFLFIFMSHRRNLIDIIKGIEAPSTLLVNT